MRSNIYDGLPNELASLGRRINSKTNLLKKSKEENALGTYLPEIVDTSNESDLLSKRINRFYLVLKDDFYNSRIQQSVYMDYLRSFKTFLESIDDATDIPSSLLAIEIVKEIQKFIGGVTPKVASTNNELVPNRVSY